jgi:hypothetical protein
MVYSYDRQKTAAKLDVHSKWQDIVMKHEAAESHDFKALVHELVPYLKSNGYDLDVSKSHISKEWHGSDGWRLSGMLTITERAENVAKARNASDVADWVNEATGISGSARHVGGDTWVVDISSY